MKDDQTMADKARRLRELFRSDFNPEAKEQEMEEAQRLLEELIEYFETPEAGAEEPDILCPFCDLRTAARGDKCGWCHSNLGGGI